MIWLCYLYVKTTIKWYLELIQAFGTNTRDGPLLCSFKPGFTSDTGTCAETSASSLYLMNTNHYQPENLQISFRLDLPSSKTTNEPGTSAQNISCFCFMFRFHAINWKCWSKHKLRASAQKRKRFGSSPFSRWNMSSWSCDCFCACFRVAGETRL